MKNWQEKAIRKGRTPLPDCPGDKPSLTTVGDFPAPKNPLMPVPLLPMAPLQPPLLLLLLLNQSYRFWSESDLRRLIEMRNGGMEWNTIAVEFPERSLESVKQTFHKRRHALQKRMAEERVSQVDSTPASKEWTLDILEDTQAEMDRCK
ncbi:hypothetical protein BKA59DRAFT_514041 [Fusarium tricinctum]|uniref:Myb-like domain-containing protein n=1 Tax=Fusarium tricinctum TaxID=61284 RepID=A0A8K0WAD1_9HYPO|nr:hypothetical protein BKA59DRAFT_514041 [Fusarium tricinctum]